MRSAGKGMDAFYKQRLDLTLPKEMIGPHVFPSGNLWLDEAILHVGGFCRGILTELFGRESSGKSTVCLHVAANAQKLGFNVAYLDTEGFLANDFGRSYAQTIGVDLDPTKFSYWYETGPAQELLQGMKGLIESGNYGLVVIDSLAFLRTFSQLDAMSKDAASMGKVADLASVLTLWCPELAKAAWKHDVCLIVTNQMRVNMQANPLAARTGPLKKAARAEEVTPGGRAWRHAVGVRLFFQRVDALYAEGVTPPEVIGTIAEALLVKSRISPPLRRTGKDCPELTFFFDGRLMDEADALVDYGVRCALVERDGSGTYTLPGGQKIRGKEKFMAHIRENKELRDWLYTSIMAAARKAPSEYMASVASDEGVSVE